MIERFRRVVIIVGVAIEAGCGGGDSADIGTAKQAATAEQVCLPPSAITRIAPSQGFGKFPISRPSISADGRFVAFDSGNDNLVPNDTNGVIDVFVLDRLIGQIERVSVKSDGSQVFGQFGSLGPQITPNGRYVVFESNSEFVPGQGTNVNVFRRDRVTGITLLVSVRPDGALPNGSSRSPAVSTDGSIVAFDSSASDLVPGDTNDGVDVFVRDLTTGQTARVSVTSDGSQVGDISRPSAFAALNGDGRLVAFESTALGLVPGDTNAAGDVFVHDRVTHVTSRASVTAGGAQLNGASGNATFTPDAQFLAFASRATNVIPGGTTFVDHANIYLRNQTTGDVTFVSVATNGGEPQPGPNAGTNFLGGSLGPSMTPDARFVAFGSTAIGLVSGDTNGIPDVFVRDRTLGQTTRVSVASNGAQGTGSLGLGQVDGDVNVLTPSLSADGRSVAFGSIATNLVSGDTNGVVDLFVRDLRPTPAPWTTGHAYQTGDLVTSAGKTWECRLAHTSLVGWDPAQTPALWQIPTPCGVTPWAVRTAYLVGSRVTFQGNLYECTQAHTADSSSWDPVHTPNLWHLL